MRAILTVDMDGAAFAEDGAQELANIFATAAECIRQESGIRQRVYLDINGNRVGELRIEDGAETECGKTLAIYAGHPVLCVRVSGHSGHHNHLPEPERDATVPPHRLED